MDRLLNDGKDHAAGLSVKINFIFNNMQEFYFKSLYIGAKLKSSELFKKYILDGYTIDLNRSKLAE